MIDYNLIKDRKEELEIVYYKVLVLSNQKDMESYLKMVLDLS